MSPPSYLCKCDIHPDGHYVRKAHKATHLLQVRQFRAQEATALVPTIEGTNTALQNGGTEKTTETDDDSIASLLTGITLTDDGRDTTKQHNKLWSSSDELDTNVPSIMTKIPFGDVQASVRAITEASPPSLVLPRPCSPSLSASRSQLPRPAAFIRPSPNVKSTVRKAMSIIEAVEADARITAATLNFQNHVPPDDILRKLLDTATLNVDSGGKSLALVKNQAQSVVESKCKTLEILRAIDARISQLGALLSPLPATRKPAIVEARHIHENPVAKLDTIAQVMILLGAVCHIIIGLSSEPCDFIIGIMSMLVKMAMATGVPNPNPKPEYTSPQKAVLDQLPTSLFTALNRFSLNGHTTIFAACPSCHFTHKATYDPVLAIASYPTHCINRLLGSKGRYVCGASLLQVYDGHSRPLKPFVTASFSDYLARSLADPEVERLCKRACDIAMKNIQNPLDEMTNVFDANFMKTFNGPIPNELFINRGDKIRLAFAMHVDFFNPNGTRKRGNHDSIGIISLANLNLPETIRYLPEHIFLLGVIPGPKEPTNEELNYYIRPIIDELEVGWEHGFHILQTADAPVHGEVVEVALALSINDLPAARKVAGMAGVGSHFYCTVCDGYGVNNTYNTNFEQWGTRNAAKTRGLAVAWRDAETLKARKKIFAEHGVRWSELWRLPYWDPTRMLVIDSMHCILEGLVHYHCRRVLCIDAEVAAASTPQEPTYTYPWTSYDPNMFPELLDFTDLEVQQVGKIQRLLTLPINSGDGTLDDSELLDKLLSKNLKPLKYVSFSLALPKSIMMESGVPVPAKTKIHFAMSLVNWRLKMPRSSSRNVVKPITMKALRYIQHVIKTTSRPSWINSVPARYGESSAGTIKADEWRILSTIYLPITLITLWGDNDGFPPPDGSPLLQLLDHTMSLFQAVTLVVRYTMTPLRATNYRKFIKEWVDGLYELHPHTMNHDKRPNVHAAFHLYDFLLLFGPVISWWCFPFERLIGTLQKINTNDLIGGPLEQTILRSHVRAANLRQWLRRSDCPEIIRQFKVLFDKAFSSVSREETAPNIPLPHVSHEVAHYTHNGRNYSRASTHLGNSLVLYYPTTSSTKAVAGSIEKMTVSAKGVQLLIRRQKPLPAGQYDPFSRYPLFPAATYASAMVDGPADKVTFDSIVSQVVRFNFSFNRTVILNLSRA